MLNIKEGNLSSGDYICASNVHTKVMSFEDSNILSSKEGIYVCGIIGTMSQVDDRLTPKFIFSYLGK